MRLIPALALTAMLLAPARGEARPIVVFPLDARGVAMGTAEQATSMLRKTLMLLPRVEVIDTRVVEHSMGLHLTDQARACEYDVLCLTEVGEILRSEQMIIGHVRRGPKDLQDSDLELKLYVLDVSKAVITDTLVWRVPSQGGALDDAIAAATRRLFSKPNIKVSLELRPENAEIVAYGEALPRAKDNILSLWPGEYHVVVRAEGFQPLETKISIPLTGATTVKLELQPDLLYVPGKKPKEVQPFDKASRRDGSGVSALDVGTGAPVEDRVSPFSNIFAWSLTGAGAVSTVVGILIRNSGQSKYNTLAMEERYQGDTKSAGVARQERDDAQATHRQGSIIAGVGVAAAIGGLTWMLVDLMTDTPPRPGPRTEAGALIEVEF